MSLKDVIKKVDRSTTEGFARVGKEFNKQLNAHEKLRGQVESLPDAAKLAAEAEARASERAAAEVGKLRKDVESLPDAAKLAAEAEARAKEVALSEASKLQEQLKALPDAERLAAEAEARATKAANASVDGLRSVVSALPDAVKLTEAALSAARDYAGKAFSDLTNVDLQTVESLNKLKDALASNEDGDKAVREFVSGTVRFDEQKLDETQAATARRNINAVSRQELEDELSDVETSDYVRAFEEALAA